MKEIKEEVLKEMKDEDKSYFMVLEPEEMDRFFWMEFKKENE